MKSLRVVGFLMLCLAVIWGLAPLGGASQAGWRDKLSPSLLRWFDSGGTDERVVLVSLSGAAAGGLATDGYVAAAHGAYLGETLAAARADVSAKAELVQPGILLRSGGTVWESGLPYFHGLGALVVRCTRTQASALAQLGTVAALVDGQERVPAPASLGTAAAAAPSGMDSPAGLLALGKVPASELGQGASAYAWDVICLEDVVPWGDEARYTLQPDPATAWDEGTLEVVGIALVGAGAPPAISLPWAERTTGSMTTSDLAWLVDALVQAGGDTAAVGRVGSTGGDADVVILLRSDRTRSLASLGGAGDATPSAGAWLPRAAAPNAVTATLGTHADRVLVDWEGVSGSSQYEVLRTTSVDPTYVPIGLAGFGGFYDTDVETCVQYTYRVRSLGSGVGLESQAARGYVGLVPHAVERIWTTADSAGRVVVEWTPVAGATGYSLMRTEPMSDKPKVPAQQYQIYEGAAPQFVDTDVMAGQKHFYRVFSQNGCGRGDLSPQAEGMALYDMPPDPSLLTAPVWVEATRGRPYDRVDLSWRAVPGASAYRVLRALSYRGPFEPVIETFDTMWTDTDVTLCSDQWYRVQSLSSSSESEPSAIVYGSYGYRPEAPKNVRASAGTYANSIEITWSAMKDALWYTLSRAPAREGPYAVLVTQVTTTGFRDEGLVPGQEFWYKAGAVNPCGCSGFSEPTYGATARK